MGEGGGRTYFVGDFKLLALLNELGLGDCGFETAEGLGVNCLWWVEETKG